MLAQSADPNGDRSSLPPASPTSQRDIDPGQPFSKLAIGPSISPLGIGLDLTTNLNRHPNLRASGSFFDQPIHFTTNGFHADAKVKLASTRASLDIYPFHTGFRISPGLLVYNQNRITATEQIAGGSSFTLNGDTYYSANANAATGAVPINGTALLNLKSQQSARGRGAERSAR